MTSEDRFKVLERLSFFHKLSDLHDCDLVVEVLNSFNFEAATEQFDLKKRIFQELSTVVQQDAILASNTSSISITKLAAVSNRPEKVIGMHFMNPVPVMKLIELIKGLQTS
jgi:3-hydroxybutyryl-CoA dehydrogenase